MSIVAMMKIAEDMLVDVDQQNLEQDQIMALAFKVSIDEATRIRDEQREALKQARINKHNYAETEHSAAVKILDRLLSNINKKLVAANE